MDTILFTPDCLVLICSYFDWHELTLMRCVCKQTRDIITKNRSALVINVSLKSPTVPRIVNDPEVLCTHPFKLLNKLHLETTPNVFYHCCSHLDFSEMRDFDWEKLLQFSNKLHYLSFRESFPPHLVIYDCWYKNRDDEKYKDMIEMLDVYPQTREKIKNFFENNFSRDDINLFFNHLHNNWFHEEEYKDSDSEYDYYSVCDNLLKEYRQKYDHHEFYQPDDPTMDLNGEDEMINFEIIADTPKNTGRYMEYVRIIQEDINAIKEKIAFKKKVKEWFRNAEIDIVDLRDCHVNNSFIKCMTKCKKIISHGTFTSHLVKKFLREQGVEVVEYVEPAKCIENPKENQHQ